VENPTTTIDEESYNVVLYPCWDYKVLNVACTCTQKFITAFVDALGSSGIKCSTCY